MDTVSVTIESEAHQAWQDGQHSRAYKLFRQCAEIGDAGCMLNLGYFFDEGIDVIQDEDKAMYWYKKAYRCGYLAAASNIAILYREQGNRRLMFQWFKRSVALGDGDSEVELANLYMTGTGVRKSLSKATDLLRRATVSPFITEAGSEEATALLDEIGNVP